MCFKFNKSQSNVVSGLLLRQVNATGLSLSLLGRFICVPSYMQVKHFIQCKCLYHEPYEMVEKKKNRKRPVPKLGQFFSSSVNEKLHISNKSVERSAY